MAARVPTHVPAVWGPFVTVGVLVFTYHACSLFLETLTLLGLGVSSGYLLVLDPECTIHTTCTFAGQALHIRVSTHVSLRASLHGHYIDHTTELTCSTQMLMSDLLSTEPSPLVQYINIFLKYKFFNLFIFSIKFLDAFLFLKPLDRKQNT